MAGTVPAEGQQLMLLTDQPWASTPNPDADPDPLLQQISFAVMGVIIAVGSIGNSVVLYVYSQKRDRQTANIFIMSLAATDTVACTLVIPMTLGIETVKFRTNLLVCKLYYLLNASGIPFSCMLMTAIAVDRYFCICRPFLRAITMPRARAIVLVLGSLAVTLGITTSAFCSGVVAQTGPNGSWQHAGYGFCKEINDMKSLNASDLNVSDASLAFYNVFQKVHVSLFGICITVVFVLYISIYRSVLAMRRKRRELKGRPSRQSRGAAGGRGGGGGGDRSGAAQAEKVTTVAEAAAAPLEASEMQEQLLQAAAARPEPDVVASTAGSEGRTRFVEPGGSADEVDDGAAAAANDDVTASASAAPSASTELLKKRRKSMKLAKDSDTLQNMKTAAMLFVVTIVFACTFVPAALMSLKLLDFNIIILYMYYLTHATNPLIYCFMNQNFRDDLWRIFCHSRRRGGGGGGTSVGGTGGGSQRQPVTGTASSGWQR